MQDTVNNGVYKAGFAQKQEVYEASLHEVFKSLHRLEKILSDGREYLLGSKLTEAGIMKYHSTNVVSFTYITFRYTTISYHS